MERERRREMRGVAINQNRFANAVELAVIQKKSVSRRHIRATTTRKWAIFKSCATRENLRVVATPERNLMVEKVRVQKG